MAALVPEQRSEQVPGRSGTRSLPIAPSRRRRRPSGEAPPLPRALNTTGRYWLAATGFVLIVWVGALANDRTTKYVLVFDQTVLGWITGLRSSALTNVMQAVDALGSNWTLRILFWSTILVLLVVRRFRHLFVFLGTSLLVIALTTIMTYVLLRTRPLEIEILGDWAMFANPSRPVAAFSAILVGMLYALAPRAGHGSSARRVSSAWSPPSPWPASTLP